MKLRIAKLVGGIGVAACGMLFAFPAFASGNYTVFGGGAGSLSGSTVRANGGFVNDSSAWTASGTLSHVTIFTIGCAGDFIASVPVTGSDQADALVTVAGTDYVISSSVSAGGCKSRPLGSAQGVYSSGTYAGGVFTLTGNTMSWQPVSETNAFYDSYVNFRTVYCGADISSGSISHRNCVISAQWSRDAVAGGVPVLLHPADGSGYAYTDINAASDAFRFLGVTGSPTATGTGTVYIYNGALSYQCTMSGTVSASLVDGRYTGLNLGRTVDGSTSGGQCGTIPLGTYHAQMKFSQTGVADQFSAAVTFDVSANGAVNTPTVWSAIAGSFASLLKNGPSGCATSSSIWNDIMQCGAGVLAFLITPQPNILSDYVTGTFLNLSWNFTEHVFPVNVLQAFHKKALDGFEAGMAESCSGMGVTIPHLGAPSMGSIDVCAVAGSPSVVAAMAALVPVLWYVVLFTAAIFIISAW